MGLDAFDAILKVDEFLEDLLRVMFKQILMNLSNGSIHDWGTKNECLIEKALQRTILDFILFYIIMIVVHCCMPIEKMMFS
jgi:hypothetical protein